MSTGAHKVTGTGLNGPCVLLETPDHPHLAYAEAQRSSVLTSDADIGGAAHPSTLHIRDSKDPQGPHLDFSPGAWASFTSYASGSAAATPAP
ncbi:DUF397 domain-containing protein [Streptomyces sp. Edi2]|uniref:DUF397 domain-containing protein n=1 Tax=Streptomyces sp. Edi2 TaxID=3162528 RepID=UPI0033057482